MAEVELFIKPYEARQAYIKKSAQTSIGTLLTSIVADVNTELQYICRQCAQPEDLTRIAPYPTTAYGMGLIPNPNDPTKKIECPNCQGWGKTAIIQIVPTPTYTPQNIPPTVEP